MKLRVLIKEVLVMKRSTCNTYIYIYIDIYIYIYIYSVSVSLRQSQSIHIHIFSSVLFFAVTCSICLKIKKTNETN